jgi:hypothetical protein
MDNFDYKKYLVENKLTSNSRLNEDMDSTSEKKSMLLSKLKSLVPGKEKAFLEFMGEAADSSQDYSGYSMGELLDMFIDFEENENGEEFTSEIADEVLTMYVRGFKRFLKTGEIEF